MALQGKRLNLVLFVKWQPTVWYKSFFLAKFINKLSTRGNQEKIEGLVFNIFEEIRNNSDLRAVVLFYESVELLTPLIGLVAKRKGKKIHQVPIPLLTTRTYKIAISWLTSAIKQRKEPLFFSRIMQEFLSIFTDHRSPTLQRKNEFYALIAYNRTYSHFRWI